MNLLKTLGGIRSHLITTSNLVFCTCMDASEKIRPLQSFTHWVLWQRDLCVQVFLG